MHQGRSEQEESQAAGPSSIRLADVQFTLFISVVAIAMSLALWNGASVSFAIANKAVWAGQYWRLVTTTFVHGNTVHLVSSLVFFWILGARLERRYGLWRIALLYGVLAVGSSAAQFLSGWTGVGMSGVLYGYLGLILAAGNAATGPRFKLRPLIAIAMLIFFVLGFVVPVTETMRIGVFSHGAGLAIGLAMGCALRARRPLKPLTLVALASVALAPATSYMPWSYWWWNHRVAVMQKRAETEQALFAARRAIDLAPCDEAVAPLLIYVGIEAIDREAFEEAIEWFARAMLVTELPAGAKIDLASAYYETFRDADARWLLLQVNPEDLTPWEQSEPFYTWFLEWARTSETQPASAPEADSQPACETPQSTHENIRRLLLPAGSR
jgi:membrane associated rhomboid family serine protease